MGAERELELEPVSDAEVAYIAEWIPLARERGLTHPLSASMVALGLPRIDARDRIQLVLDEMEHRGLLERVDQEADHLVGEPRYREIQPPSSTEGVGDA